MSTVKKNALEDKKEIFTQMKEVVQEGVIKVELYNKGELITTLTKPEDFTEDIQMLFSERDMTIKTVASTLQTLVLPLD
jgi:hypothetical protein